MRVEIQAPNLERAELLLNGIPGAAQRARQSAFNRGILAGKAEGTRQIKQRYAITTGNLKKYEKVTLRRASGASDAELKFEGPKVPLFKFTPVPKNRSYTGRRIPVPISLGTEENGKDKWRLAFANTDVKAMDIFETGYKTGPQWFIATFQNGHTGIFKRRGQARTGTGQQKLEEIWGQSVSDMIDYEPARESVMERTAQVVNDRLEHEIGRELGKF